MVGYWIYKYQIEDQDKGIVYFIPIEEATDIPWPIVSLCSYDSIVEEKLMKEKPSVTNESYLQYLRGESYERRLEIVNYRNVSLSLGNYSIYAREIWRYESYLRNSSLSIKLDESFSGIFFNQFCKCFALSFTMEKKRLIKGIRYYHDLLNLFLDLKPEPLSLTNYPNKTKASKLLAKMNYPDQLLLGERMVIRQNRLSAVDPASITEL